MRKLCFGLASLSLVAVLGGCESGPCGLDPNTLDGSIGELYDIQVDTVGSRLSMSDDSLTIDFKHGNDSVAKVVADNITASFERGVSIPLTDGSVYRVTSPTTQFPRNIERGSVTIESELNVGAPVEGCFSVLFNMDDMTQRNLSGAFSSMLEEGL